MLAADKNLLIMFLGGEYALHFLVKVLRDDFFAYFRTEGLLGGVLSLIHHLILKLVVGERAKRASLDENSSNESREMATDGYINY